MSEKNSDDKDFASCKNHDQFQLCIYFVEIFRPKSKNITYRNFKTVVNSNV